MLELQLRIEKECRPAILPLFDRLRKGAEEQGTRHSTTQTGESANNVSLKKVLQLKYLAMEGTFQCPWV